MNTSYTPIGQVDQVEAYRRLGFAILEQAVDDIKMCIRGGVINSGRSVTSWPQPTRTQRRRITNHFDRLSKVHELVEWVHSQACEQLIDELDAPITQSDLIGLLNGNYSQLSKPSMRREV